MTPLFLIGNWKSNMTLVAMNEWFSLYTPSPNLTIVLCVPFTLLSSVKNVILEKQLDVAIGAQDVSPFGSGPYTGEISAEMIKEFASYVLVGHSERRQYFNESAEELAFQSLQAKSAGLTVIYCTGDEQETIPQSVDIVAYEPIEAIGTGIPEKPDAIQTVCTAFRKTSGKPVIYGGSVTEETIMDILHTKSVDGLLVGGSSLDPVKFSAIGRICSSVFL
ncbi:MAG: triose-phosphate isomerase family protein [Candidatus Gottesmanbacteria bacterium]